VTSFPTRVLLVAPSLDIVGGQAVQASRLLELLQNEPSIRVEFLPINPRLPGPLRMLQRVKYLRTAVTSGAFLCKLLIKAWRFDILHSFSAANYSFLLSAAPVIVVSRMFRKSSIVNYRDGRASQHLAQWRTSRLLRLADRIVSPSEYLVDVFAQFGYRAQSIYNLIDLDRFRFRERKPVRPVFLHNRGLEQLYNVPCTLKAFGIVQQRYPEACLTIAHDGPMRTQLERMVGDLRLRNVKFVGTVPQHEVPDLYDGADIYLTSPNIDNMPGSLLECYASGLPLVATRAGGIPYIARNEETALLVDLNDHEAMARAALRLIEEEGLAERLAKAARLQCELYSPTAIRKDWLALYAELHLSGS
jgi:glycosyltransferase involved in cell wall biosynthesis